MHLFGLTWSFIGRTVRTSRWRSNRICEIRCRGEPKVLSRETQHHPLYFSNVCVANEFQAPPSTRLQWSKEMEYAQDWILRHVGGVPHAGDTTPGCDREGGSLTPLFAPRSNHPIQCYLRSSRRNISDDRRDPFVSRKLGCAFSSRIESANLLVFVCFSFDKNRPRTKRAARRKVMMNIADQEVPAATTELAGLVSSWKFIYLSTNKALVWLMRALSIIYTLTSLL